MRLSQTEREQDEDGHCDFVCVAPAACQPLGNKYCLVVWLSLFSFAQGLAVNGFINSVITTLERRYNLTSTESGLIASAYDIGVVVVLIPLTFFGAHGRLPRLVAIGALTASVGSFLFALPHALSGLYRYAGAVTPLCYPEAAGGANYTDMCPSGDDGHLSNYKYMLWAGQLLHGLGAAPLYTLGVSALEINLSASKFSLFVGIFYASGILGPAVGYIVGGMLLNIYVDVGENHTGITNENTTVWVGAWWIGFLISGFLFLIVTVPLFGFPRYLPGHDKVAAAKQCEAYGKSHAENPIKNYSLRELFPAILHLLMNPTFILLSLLSATEGFVISGVSTFGPKYLETMFSLSASRATLLMGALTVPAGTAGMLFGGLMVERMKLKMRGILRMTLLLVFISLASSFVFIVMCPDNNIAGVTTNYVNTTRSLDPPNIDASCNAQCSCVKSRLMYSSVCGADNNAYFSPCYAGCLYKSGDTYSGCGCIKEGTAKSGVCSTDCNSTFVIFLVVFFALIFTTFSSTAPALTATIRSVPDNQKAFSLGVQAILFRCLGSVPGPILFGKLIDDACYLEVPNCGNKSYCHSYDKEAARNRFGGLGISLKAASAIGMIFVCLLYKPPTTLPLKKDKVEVSETSFNVNHAYVA